MKFFVRDGRSMLATKLAPWVAKLALRAGWLFGHDPQTQAVLGRWLARHGQRTAALSLSHERDAATLSLLGMHASAARLLPAPLDDARSAAAVIRSLLAIGDSQRAMEVIQDALARWPESRTELLLVSMGAPCELLLPLARGETVLEAVLLHACDGDREASKILAGAGADLRVTPDVDLLRANLAIRAGDFEGATRRVNAALGVRGLRPVSISRERSGIAAVSCRSQPVESGPLVSVVMPVRNVAGLVGSALSSVLNQDHQALEVIVVDDASDDATAQVIEQLASADQRVTLLRETERAGTYRARNRGLLAASGEYVTFHDGDDWSHPQKITEQMNAIRAQPRAVASVSDWVRMRSDGSFVARQVFPLIRMNTSSLMFQRRQVLDRVGLFDDVRTGADSEYQARLQLLFGGTHAISRVRKLLSFATWRDDSLMNDPATGYGSPEGTRQRLDYWESWNRAHLQACKAWNPARKLKSRSSGASSVDTGAESWAGTDKRH